MERASLVPPTLALRRPPLRRLLADHGSPGRGVRAPLRFSFSRGNQGEPLLLQLRPHSGLGGRRVGGSRGRGTARLCAARISFFLATASSAAADPLHGSYRSIAKTISSKFESVISNAIFKYFKV